MPAIWGHSRKTLKSAGFPPVTRHPHSNDAQKNILHTLHFTLPRLHARPSLRTGTSRKSSIICGRIYALFSEGPPSEYPQAFSPLGSKLWSGITSMVRVSRRHSSSLPVSCSRPLGSARRTAPCDCFRSGLPGANPLFVFQALQGDIERVMVDKNAPLPNGAESAESPPSHGGVRGQVSSESAGQACLAAGQFGCRCSLGLPFDPGIALIGPDVNPNGRNPQPGFRTSKVCAAGGSAGRRNQIALDNLPSFRRGGRW